MIIIAVGSNLSGVWSDTPYGMCQGAVHRLSVELQCDIIQSSWYQTSPIPPSSQPFYVNGVIAFEKNISATNLLRVLNNLEQEAGRLRQQINEARPLDLDIIDMNGKVIDMPPTLIVPHPRLHLRGFVLYPLRDIAPQWIHPTLNLSINELIDKLPKDQKIMPYREDVIEEV